MAAKEITFSRDQEGYSSHQARVGVMFESHTAYQTIPVSSLDSTSEQNEPHFAIHPLTGQLVEIDPEQRWFWTPGWLAKEMEVEQALQNGEYEDFDSMDDFLATL